MIRLDTKRRRPKEPIRVLFNGREVDGVVSLVALWNGGPGLIEMTTRIAGRLVVDDMRQDVCTHNRFGLVRVEAIE